MIRQFELDRKNSKLEPFNPREIHGILKSNLGLRLTHNHSEIRNGGTGDSVPLSDLAGANKSLKFITLSAKILQNPSLDLENQEYIKQLSHILESFSGCSHENLDYTPIIIQAYAAMLNDAGLSNFGSISINTAFKERRLPKDEENFLLKCYHVYHYPLDVSFVFNIDSPQYAALPSLRLHLMSDFNQLLEKRLNLNKVFYSGYNMYYLLLKTEDETRFKNAYDCSHYPLGKSGKAPFSSNDVLSFTPVDPEAIRSIWVWLKQQSLASSNLLPSHSMHYPAPQQLANYFYRNTPAIASGLVGLGIFAGARYVLSRNQLEDHPIHPGLS